jgi:hypothetical protein
MRVLHRKIGDRLGRQSFFYTPEIGIKGYEGEGPIVVIGYRPSTDLWKYDAPSRRLLYDTMKENGVGGAYLTDCIKERSRVKDDEKNYDLHWNLAVLSRELEIIRPALILALGQRSERFLYKHSFAHRYSIGVTHHFGIVHQYWSRWKDRDEAAQAFRDSFVKALNAYERAENEWSEIRDGLRVHFNVEVEEV